MKVLLLLALSMGSYSWSSTCDSKQNDAVEVIRDYYANNKDLSGLNYSNQQIDYNILINLDTSSDEFDACTFTYTEEINFSSAEEGCQTLYISYKNDGRNSKIDHEFKNCEVTKLH